MAVELMPADQDVLGTSDSEHEEEAMPDQVQAKQDEHEVVVRPAGPAPHGPQIIRKTIKAARFVGGSRKN